MLLQRFLLEGQVAIITGGSSGIGRATALLFSEAGATVVLAARGAARLFKTADEIRKLGRHANAVPTDVTVPSQLDALVDRTMADLGRIDVVVNVAGGAPPGPAVGLADDDFEATFHLNVTSALHLSRAAAPHMAKAGGGTIVNVSSAMSHRVDTGFMAIGAAKAALNQMTRLLAHEWAPKIRVNAVAPGTTLTDSLELVVSMEGIKQAMAEKTPLGRIGEPEDIALAILYLASPASSWVTGKVLEIDGGAVGSTWPIPIPSGLP